MNLNFNLVTTLIILPIVFLIGFSYLGFTLGFGVLMNVALGVLGLSLLSMYYIGIHCYNCLCRSDQSASHTEK